jgi:hypothetical protein
MQDIGRLVKVLIPAVVATALLAGCRSKELTREQAAELLRSAQLGRPKVVRMEASHSGRCSETAGSQPGWNALLQAGWITLKEEDKSYNMLGVNFPNFICDVVSTSAGQAQLRRVNEGIFDFYEAEVARPGNVTVNGVSQQGTEATVDFSYGMVLTAAGNVLVEPYSGRNARAQMRRFDDGWRIEQISRPNADEMDDAFGTMNLTTDTRLRQVAWNPRWAPNNVAEGAPPGPAAKPLQRRIIGHWLPAEGWNPNIQGIGLEFFPDGTAKYQNPSGLYTGKYSFVDADILSTEFIDHKGMGLGNLGCPCGISIQQEGGTDFLTLKMKSGFSSRLKRVSP